MAAPMMAAPMVHQEQVVHRLRHLRRLLGGVRKLSGRGAHAHSILRPRSRRSFSPHSAWRGSHCSELVWSGYRVCFPIQEDERIHDVTSSEMLTNSHVCSVVDSR